MFTVVLELAYLLVEFGVVQNTCFYVGSGFNCGRGVGVWGSVNEVVAVGYEQGEAVEDWADGVVGKVMDIGMVFHVGTVTANHQF